MGRAQIGRQLEKIQQIIFWVSLVLMKFLSVILFSIFLFSCGNDNSVSNAITKRDSVDSVKKVLTKISADSLKRIDSIVAAIRKKIADGKLRKKEMADGMKSLSGGFVYAYFENETSLVYLYSDNGLEFGSSEIECFFYNDEPIFSLRNRIKFGQNGSGTVDPSVRLKTASESTYFSNGKIMQQQTQTFTKETGWKKIPFQDQLQKIIRDIQGDLNRHGVWEK